MGGGMSNGMLGGGRGGGMGGMRSMGGQLAGASETDSQGLSSILWAMAQLECSAESPLLQGLVKRLLLLAQHGRVAPPHAHGTLRLLVDTSDQVGVYLQRGGAARTFRSMWRAAGCLVVLLVGSAGALQLPLRRDVLIGSAALAALATPEAALASGALQNLTLELVGDTWLNSRPIWLLSAALILLQAPVCYLSLCPLLLPRGV